MFSMNNILARAFYALNDIKTPMKISVFCLFLNLGFALWLVQGFREAGLGVANTLSATCNLILLAYALKRKLPSFDFRPLKRTLLLLIFAAILAALVAYASLSLWERKLGHGSLLPKLGAVFIPATLAGLAYAAAAWWSRVPAARDTAGVLLRRLRRQP
jgi:putative peptidoglycan lipid II flippase